MNTAHYEQKLRDELARLETELSSVGRKNPDNPKDWEPVAPNLDTDAADDLEIAEEIDEYEGNTAIVKELEIRYNEVKAALERITNGTYGICEISGEPIEEERLEANPAARTSIANKEREGELQ